MRSLNFRFWLSFIAVVMALSTTLVSISWLKGNHSQRFLNSLGLGSNQDMLNWCSNRVRTMTLPGRADGALVEEDNQWVWKGQDTVALDYIAVEKWFAKHCQLPIKRVGLKDFTNKLTPMLEVEFVNGDALTFYDLGENRIQAHQKIFQSEKFRQALKELLDFVPHVQ